MAPKKQVPMTETEQQSDLPSTSDGTSGPRSASVEELCKMLSGFMQEQRQKDELQRKEAERQEQRWRAMQHQFGLLQQQVSTTRWQERSERGAEGEVAGESVAATERASSTRILRMASAAEETAYAQLGPPVTAWPTPRLPMLKDSDNVEHFLTVFERLATAAGWPEQLWAIHLVPLLDGKARSAYVAMEPRDALDYACVKNAILQKFEISPETYRLRFRNDVVGEDESPRELYVRIKGLYEKWMLPNTKTKEQIGETIILEQFLKVVNPDLRSWILERGPSSAADAAKMAEAYVTARRAEGPFQLGGGNSGRFKETGESKWAVRSGFKPKVSKPFSRGHQSFKTAEGTVGSLDKPGASHIFKCFNCNEPGHKASVCPRLARGTSQLGISPGINDNVSLVEKPAEMTVTVKIAGKKLKALVDTGASQTLVLNNCLPDDMLKLAGRLKVKCVHGDEVVYPTAEVNMEIQGQTYLLTVGVMQNSPYKVILGRDVPVLIDLLTDRQNESEVLVATRQRAKSAEEGNRRTLSELPFSDVVKAKKSKRERRQAKVRGTKITEPVAVADLGSGLTNPSLAELQKNDTTLHSLFLKAVQGTLDRGSLFVIRDQILYRQKGEQEQLVVPKDLRAEVLKMGHSEQWAGHMGKAKTLSRILARFYWPGLHLDVVSYCRSCPQCQLTAPSNKSDRAPLINLPIVDEPFSRIAMDIVGPLPRSRSGNRYILTLCDYATRYPEAFALRNVKTRQVVNALIQLISRVGIPREILTDQGTNFTSKQLKDVFSLLGIKGLKTTPYHPQTDGLVERFNKTLKVMLRRFVNETGSDWDTWLPYVLFAYREVPQASVGFSPFQLLYGREVRGPLDVLKETWEGQSPGLQLNVLSHVLKMRERLAQATQIAHENLEQAQHQQKSWYDRSARKRALTPGDSQQTGKYLHSDHFFSRDIQDTTGPKKVNMSTSKKHQTFCSQSMTGKSVTSLPGIGKANGGRLQGHGTDSATQVLGHYLINGGNQPQFQSWLKENSGANSKHSADCYNGLREWSNNNL
ncbi:hypothetical protein SRHO_G00252130 [Serrasalmus rhombeus]